MTVDTIKATDEIVSCSDNGQHPLVYINLKDGKGKCQPFPTQNASEIK